MPPLFREDLDHVLAHTRDLWPEARGQSFFITGGTGFFGMWLLETFVHANDSLGLGMRATVLTRHVAAFAQKAPHLARRHDLTFIEGDVRNFAFPPAFPSAASGPFPYIIHAATPASAKLNTEAPGEMFDTIIAGTRRVLDLAALPTTGTRKLLLTSSGAVYGRQPPGLTHIPETYAGAPDSLDPASAYGLGKLAAEHMCVVDAARHGYEIKIARCFAFVGPYLPLDAHFAIGNFIRDALAGGPIRITGDGTPYRSYLYAADLAIWLWTLLFRAPSARAYNVGSAEEISIARLVQLVSAAFGLPVPPCIIQKADPARYVPATARAETELGLRPFIDLPQAISRVADWYRLALSRPNLSCQSF
ncbi:nucleoside-diphosphate-sugar epimerase [Opitutaceae bacterium TAV1]|nr:nucleoside-diphosphate-sugar epimerase [Opitutaceae bacterium TAV1]